MTKRIVMMLVMAGVWTAQADTNVRGEGVAVPSGGDTNAVTESAPAAPLAPVLAPAEAEPANPIPGADDTGFSLERFSIGTRVTDYELDSGTKQDNFLGHIDELEAIQDRSPTKVYADFWVFRYAGVELTWDRVEARTHNDDPEGISDGNLIAQGPILSLMARFPNKTRLTPMAGIGWAFMSIDFEEEPWWALGYPSPESYEELGRPAVPRGKTREMLPEDSAKGDIIVLGLDVRISRHWSANLYYRTMDLDTTMGYRTAGDLKEAKPIPLSNTAMGAGVKYVF